jgi:tetratricopeptide (TPR) repeat protein
VGEEHGVHYYAMQLVEGQSLADMLHGLRGSSASNGTTAPNNALTAGAPSALGRGQGEGASVIGNSRSPQSSHRGRGSIASEAADHVRAVARLGVQAAEALHAAHEYGVVHRDIKPSNMLVDDQGKLWITDFGLARCREDAGLTQTGDVLGTMRYMSPEQARGQAAMIDHRSDVYSLGVTLYELAALHHPAEGLSDVQLYFERDQRPVKPLRQWNRHITVDFQTIVLKAMAESPAERYTSAQELADDLNRFLDGKPILATPPTVWMKTHKWLRRHRGAVAAAAATLVVASIATVFVFAQQKAAAERSFAELLKSTRQTHDALYRLSVLGEQLAAIPGADSVRQQLFDRLIELYSEFQRQAVDDPSVASELALAYSKSGSLFEMLNEKDRAIESHEKAIRIWRERLSEQPSNREDARNLALCQNNLGLLLAEQGDASRAIELLTMALRSQAELRANDPELSAIDVDIATSHSNLGLVYSKLGRKQDAVREFNAAIEIQEPLAKSSSAGEASLRTLAASYNNLASLYDAGQAANAVDVYQKAIVIQLQLVKAHRDNRLYQGDLARTYNNLGYLAARNKDWQKAELCYADAIEIQKNLVRASPLAAAYRRDLAISYNNVGMVQSRYERLAAAEASFKSALQLQETLLKARPNDAATLSNQGSVYGNLGLLLEKQRRQAEAETALRQAVDYQKRARGALPTNGRYRDLLGAHLNSLADNLRAQAKFVEAEQVALERQQLAADETKMTQGDSAVVLRTEYSVQSAE